MINSIHQLSLETQKLLEMDFDKELIKNKKIKKMIGYASAFSMLLLPISIALMINFKSLNGTILFLGSFYFITIIASWKRECNLKLDIINILNDKRILALVKKL